MELFRQQAVKRHCLIQLRIILLMHLGLGFQWEEKPKAKLSGRILRLGSDGSKVGVIQINF